MNDRFKFRAWNKLSNEMKDVISLNINYEFPDCSNVVLETNTFDAIKTHNNPINCAVGLNNVVLMQCTGLKDKNGKLIYEGDICRNTKTDEIVSVAWHGTMAGYVWSKRKHSNIFDFGELFRAFDKYEVIGNIYENKELLDGNC